MPSSTAVQGIISEIFDNKRYSRTRENKGNLNTIENLDDYVSKLREIIGYKKRLQDQAKINMNLLRIVEEKGIEFLDGIPELRVHMVKKSIPLFFVELTVPMRRGAYDFEFEILLLVEGTKISISIYSLYVFIAERAKSAGKVSEISQLVGGICPHGLNTVIYGNQKATWILEKYLAGKPSICQSFSSPNKFCMIVYLQRVDTNLAKLNMGLSSANITKDIEEYIEKVCGQSNTRVPLTSEICEEIKAPNTTDSYTQTMIPVASRIRRPVMDSETQTIGAYETHPKDNEDMRIKIAVSRNSEKHYEITTQDLRDRIEDMQGANAIILDTLAENHALAIKDMARELSMVKKEIEILRFKRTKIITSKSVDNCV